ncbi:MAG: hypothetical protein IJ705_08255 [Oscillospiraceae bacterium]|nr:hypothetical protein [Oscillospiraceae bacterium]
MEYDFNPTEPEETETETQDGGGTEGVVDPQTGDAPDAGTDAEPGDANPAQEQPRRDFAGSGGLSEREINARVAAARRRAETDTAERMRREQDRNIAEQRIPNPLRPGEFFSGMKDFEEYGRAVRRADAEKRAKAQNRSVEEVMAEDEERAFLRRAMAEQTRRDEERNRQRELDAFVARDAADFQARFPDVDLEKLDGNPAFRRFAGSRYGREPIGDLYEDFIAITRQSAAAADARRESKAARSTGSGSGGAPAGTLSAEQRAALRDWNLNHPEMKMSEKEFLEM